MLSKTLGCLAGGGKAQILQSTLCFSEVSKFKAQPLFAPESIHSCKPDPLLCCAWVCTGHPKSSSQALRLQQFPGSKQAMDTGAASSHTCSSQRLNQPAQSLIFWSLQVPVSAPCTLAQLWHCRKSPGPGRNTLILTHSTSPWLPATHKAPTNQSTTPRSVLP